MKALEKIRVIEFCQVAAGPFAGMLLADLGADVIKVEPPGQGDSLRSWPPHSNGFSENFAALNRNKRSIVLDLKSAAGTQAGHRLIESADVVIENNRPGVMARLGLDYPTVKPLNKNLVYCSISAFGQSGPRAKDGGFDTAVQAASGIMSVTGEEGAAPVKAGVPVADLSTALYAAYTVTALLRRVADGGPGGYIDISMLGASLGVSAFQTSEYFGTGKDPKRWGSAHPRNAPYQAFKTRDTHFVLAAGNDKLWASVCKVIQRVDLVDDKHFSTTANRAANQVQLKECLEDIFAEDDAANWIERLRAEGVPCEPINTYSAALDDPQVIQSGWLSDLMLASGVQTQAFGFPAIIDAENAPIYRTAPNLGEHTQEVLEEIGLGSTTTNESRR
jgi:crotonobetainyl-CoA:carnitine CoA-transferase CaiB-like acyl-CoA transferase